MRQRTLRLFERRGLLTPDEVEAMLHWPHGGGFSVNASVRIAADDRRGLERLLRYCARPLFAQERLAWAGEHHDRLVYRLSTTLRPILAPIPYLAHLRPRLSA